MDKLKWVASYGGPLIAMDFNLQAQWGGIFRLTVEFPGAKNDYDRPPERLKYSQTIELETGRALIFGEGPLHTAFWQSAAGTIFIVRAIYSEADCDTDALLTKIDQRIFDDPCETLNFDIFTDTLVVFDSSDDGRHVDKEMISTNMRPGHYRINTATYEPDESTLFLLHRFDEMK
ncbi:hypothetical protein RHAL1_02644 [Beijerinckiaceae bacterium RH AL1]|nr:Imm21 family immunity protein [Beijerinckiaceae bacterium]VVB47114.1 hypothetical protein RHCH11_RHCH11_02589 [Beijerinckiaceae bacterium RH CH11]VVB47197.1 hypothetical protein RHAL8_02585 [Beijerinckiaceae bacterium RH AL8]VVC55722.1 hypothetical protein RHAL1_02644 [Beijerinckiaceae bacterium RH AL1]